MSFIERNCELQGIGREFTVADTVAMARFLLPGLNRFKLDTVAKALNIDVTQKIYFLTRIRCADGVPMAVEKVHMPFYRFAGIETQDLSKSLYALLKEQYGCECSKAVQSIQAGAASSHDAKLLKIKTGMPVLCISRTTYGMDGAPFEYVDSIYRGDKYIFNVTLEK